jgi:hypothetical protein
MYAHWVVTTALGIGALGSAGIWTFATVANSRVFCFPTVLVLADGACAGMKVPDCGCIPHLASPGSHQLNQAICFAVMQYTSGVCQQGAKGSNGREHHVGLPVLMLHCRLHTAQPLSFRCRALGLHLQLLLLQLLLLQLLLLCWDRLRQHACSVSNGFAVGVGLLDSLSADVLGICFALLRVCYDLTSQLQACP